MGFVLFLNVCFSFLIFFLVRFVELLFCLFVFFLPPHLHLLLFMKLENLKDCCVFVNNQTLVHSVRVNVPRAHRFFWSPCPGGSGLFPPFVPLPAPLPCGNVWEQTLFSGCAQVTLPQKCHCCWAQAAVQMPAWSGPGFIRGQTVGLFFHGLPIFKLHGRFLRSLGAGNCFV